MTAAATAILGMNYGIEVRCIQAFNHEVGTGIIKINRAVRTQLGVRPGQHVAVIGSRARLEPHQAPRALVLRATMADRGTAAVPLGRIDGMSRRMLQVEPLDCIKLFKLDDPRLPRHVRNAAMQGRAFYDDHFEQRQNGGEMSNVSIDLVRNDDTVDHNDDQSTADCDDMPNCVACGNDMAIAEALQEFEDEAARGDDEGHLHEPDCDGNCNCVDSIDSRDDDSSSDYDGDDDSETVPPLAEWNPECDDSDSEDEDESMPPLAPRNWVSDSDSEDEDDSMPPLVPRTRMTDSDSDSDSESASTNTSSTAPTTDSEPDWESLDEPEEEPNLEDTECEFIQLSDDFGQLQFNPTIANTADPEGIETLPRLGVDKNAPCWMEAARAEIDRMNELSVWQTTIDNDMPICWACKATGHRLTAHDVLHEIGIETDANDESEHEVSCENMCPHWLAMNWHA